MTVVKITREFSGQWWKSERAVRCFPASRPRRSTPQWCIPWLLLLCALGACREAPAPEPEVRGAYCFRHPYHDEEQDAYERGLLGKLQAAPVRAYVHDGEWGLVDGHPRVVRGQAYPEGSRRSVVLVYHGEPAFSESFGGLRMEEVAAPIASRAKDLASRGLPIAGVQLDFDLGARGLGRYPELLGMLRRDLPPRLRLSVTALLSGSSLSTWRDIAEQADEICPMLYGYDRGQYSFDPMRSEGFLAAMAPLGDKVVPVVGASRGKVPPEAVSLLRRHRIGGYLVFDLGGLA